MMFQSLRSKQGNGAISLVVLATMLVIMAGTASMATAQLRFANKSTTAVKAERATDRIYDDAEWLHSLDGATVLSGTSTKIVLFQAAPVRRCVVIVSSGGVVATKQRRLTVGQVPPTDCTTEAPITLDALLRGSALQFKNASGATTTPALAKSISLVLADTTGLARDELVVIPLN